MAGTLMSLLTGNKIDLLIPKDEGIEEIVKYIPNYQKAYVGAEEQLFYEKPYLETMLLVSELINLEYEKVESGIRIKEQSGMMKDRYSSLAMGCIFVSKLSRDLLSQEAYDYSNVPSCVSNIEWE